MNDVLCSLYCLDSLACVEAVVVEGNDESASPLCPYGVLISACRAVRTCVGRCACGVQLPFLVGSVQHPHARLLEDDARFFEFLCQRVRLHAYGLRHLRRGEGVHALQRLVVVAHFWCGLLHLVGKKCYLLGCPVRCSEKQRLISPVELLI